MSYLLYSSLQCQDLDLLLLFVVEPNPEMLRSILALHSGITPVGAKDRPGVQSISTQGRLYYTLDPQALNFNRGQNVPLKKPH